MTKRNGLYNCRQQGQKKISIIDKSDIKNVKVVQVNPVRGKRYTAE